MLHTVSSAELTEWIAMYYLDPWGLDRVDHGLATICALLYNANLPPTKRHQAKSPSEFMRWTKLRQMTAADDRDTDDESLLRYLTRLSNKGTR